MTIKEIESWKSEAKISQVWSCHVAFVIIPENTYWNSLADPSPSFMVLLCIYLTF